MRRQLPDLLGKAKDPGTPDTALSPLERVLREFRQAVREDLGGDLSAAQETLLDAVTGSSLILATVDRYLAQIGHRVIDRRSIRLRQIVLDRQRLADSLTRQLQALGLERKDPPPLSLRDYVVSRSEKKPRERLNGGR